MRQKFLPAVAEKSVVARAELFGASPPSDDLHPQVGGAGHSGWPDSVREICSCPRSSPSPPRWERVTRVTRDSRGRGVNLKRPLTQGALQVTAVNRSLAL